MKNYWKIVIIMFAALAFAGCRSVVDVTTEETGTQDGPVGTQVTFAAGVSDPATKAAIPFMPEGGRFVCRMFYHAKATDTEESPYDVKIGGTMTTAWLKVKDNIGSAAYRQQSYAETSGEGADLDEEPGMYYLFDKNATSFYWQNRLSHVFVALTDNVNTGDDFNMTHDITRLVETGVPELTISRMLVKPHDDPDADFTEVLPADYSIYIDPTDDPDRSNSSTEFLEPDGYYYFWTTVKTVNIGTEDEPDNYDYKILYKVTGNTEKSTFYAKTYNIFKDKSGNDYTSMAQQPDPLQAVTKMIPAGATALSNTVNLIFQHQLSQVQVNLRSSQDGSADVQAGDILSVELLGVSESAYVYVMAEEDGTVRDTDYSTVQTSATDPYGTAFSMFPRTLSANEESIGYIKSYEAVAFGRLEAIRIKWRESGTQSQDMEPHTVYYKVNQLGSDYYPLQSGKRYIYNMELRRGTVPVVQARVVNWGTDNTGYVTEGTIKK